MKVCVLEASLRKEILTLCPSSEISRVLKTVLVCPFEIPDGMTECKFKGHANRSALHCIFLEEKEKTNIIPLYFDDTLYVLIRSQPTESTTCIEMPLNVFSATENCKHGIIKRKQDSEINISEWDDHFRLSGSLWSSNVPLNDVDEEFCALTQENKVTWLTPDMVNLHVGWVQTASAMGERTTSTKPNWRPQPKRTERKLVPTSAFFWLSLRFVFGFGVGAATCTNFSSYILCASKNHNPTICWFGPGIVPDSKLQLKANSSLSLWHDRNWNKCCFDVFLPLVKSNAHTWRVYV